MSIPPGVIASSVVYPLSAVLGGIALTDYIENKLAQCGPGEKLLGVLGIMSAGAYFPSCLFIKSAQIAATAWGYSLATVPSEGRSHEARLTVIIAGLAAEVFKHLTS